VRLMGFGHRVYKNHDPRAKLMRETCHEVLGELGLHNDRLFKLGLEALTRAIEAAPDRRVAVEDQTLGMRTSDELKAELERGMTRDASDLNPMRVFAPRK